MTKIFYTTIASILLTACSTTILKHEYAVVEQKNIVKACYYDELDAAKRAAITAFLEEKKINFSANNNSVCNSHGCVQEDELRSYSAANVNISLMRRDVAADCRYFKVTLNKTPNKVNKFVWSNQEGMFDISDESDKHFIQINVINRHDVISAKMNGKYVVLNNNQPIIMSGENTLKFVINDPGYETKEFTIHTPKKAHKIIKNVTLAPRKTKVPESELGVGFKQITSRDCYLFCDHKDVLVNDEPFRFDMVKKNQHFMLNYYLFNDLNLYKTMGIDIESTYNSSENTVVVKTRPFINRSSDFKDALTKIANIGKGQRYLNEHEQILGKNIDNGSAPFLVLHLEISLYDSNGNCISVSDSALKIYTAQMSPKLYWAPDVYTSNFYGVYHREYELRYRLYLKYDDIEGHISGVGGKYETLWWWKNIDKNPYNDKVFNKLLEKYSGLKYKPHLIYD